MSSVDLKLQMVTFQLGREKYGIDIMSVKEICSKESVRPLPNAPNFIEGIFNLRGEIIPVVNLHKRFQIAKAELSEEEELLSGFVIIKLGNTSIGIIIDKVLRVVTVDEEEIQPPPQVISGIGTEYIRGVYQSEKNNYLIVLDIERLFSVEEMRQITELS